MNMNMNMNMNRIALVTATMLIPFYYENVFGIKLMFILVPAVILLRGKLIIISADKCWMLYSLLIIISSCIGVLTLGNSLTGLKQAAIFVAIFLLTETTYRSKTLSEVNFTIDGILSGYFINSIFIILIFLTVDDVSRVSGISSIGYSSTGLDSISTQASFNEVGTMTSVAALFCLMRILESKFRTFVFYKYLVIFFILVYAIILTGSRSSLASFFCGVLYYGFLRKSFIKTFTVIVAFVFLLFIFEINNILIGRTTSIIQDPESNDAISAFERILGWQDALQVFLNNPVIGAGFGFYRHASPSGYITPESYYMLLLAEIGLVGLILFLSLSYRSLRNSLKCLYSIGYKHPLAPLISCLSTALLMLLISNISGTNLNDMTFLILFFVIIRLIAVIAGICTIESKMIV